MSIFVRYSCAGQTPARSIGSNGADRNLIVAKKAVHEKLQQFAVEPHHDIMPRVPRERGSTHAHTMHSRYFIASNFGNERHAHGVIEV